MSAMPDSQPASGGLGDISFAFRFLRERGAPPLWGFSFFRARRDSRIRRGVFQKSLVLLTPLPLFEFFRSVVALLAEAYFGESGAEALHGALRQIVPWPLPLRVGATPLALLGRTLVAKFVACEPGPTYTIATEYFSGAGAAAATAAAGSGVSGGSSSGSSSSSGSAASSGGSGGSGSGGSGGGGSGGSLQEGCGRGGEMARIGAARARRAA